MVAMMMMMVSFIATGKDDMGHKKRSYNGSKFLPLLSYVLIRIEQRRVGRSRDRVQTNIYNLQVTSMIY